MEIWTRKTLCQDLLYGTTFWFTEKNSNIINHLMANPTKWSNTLKRFVGKLATNCFSVYDYFVGLVFKELTAHEKYSSLLIFTFSSLSVCTTGKSTKMKKLNCSFLSVLFSVLFWSNFWDLSAVYKIHLSFPWFGRLGPILRAFLIYQPTTINQKTIMMIL